MEVHAYAIDEIRTLQGDLRYAHDRDEPARKQLFDRKVVETLNTMLQGVVLNGTGKRGAARLHLLRRQDRYEFELPRRVVHGLHGPICHGRLAWQ